MRDLAALEARRVTDIRILVANCSRRSLVNDMILLNLELLLIHEAQLLVLYLDTLIALRDVFERIGPLALRIGHHQHFLLLV